MSFHGVLRNDILADSALQKLLHADCLLEGRYSIEIEILIDDVPHVSDNIVRR
jgi:hypothetical protein